MEEPSAPPPAQLKKMENLQVLTYQFPKTHTCILKLNYILLGISLCFYIGAIVVSLNHPHFKLLTIKCKTVGAIFISIGIYVFTVLFVLGWATEENYRDTLKNKVVEMKRWCLSRGLTTFVPLLTAVLGFYLNDREALLISLLIMISFLWLLLIIQKPEDGGMSEMYVSCIFTFLATKGRLKEWIYLTLAALGRLVIVYLYIMFINWLNEMFGENGLPETLCFQKLLRDLFIQIKWYPKQQNEAGEATQNQAQPNLNDNIAALGDGLNPPQAQPQPPAPGPAPGPGPGPAPLDEDQIRQLGEELGDGGFDQEQGSGIVEER